jgi:hypothetical protein
MGRNRYGNQAVGSVWEGNRQLEIREIPERSMLDRKRSAAVGSGIRPFTKYSFTELI